MVNLPKFLVDYKLVIKIKNKLVFLLKLLLQESLKRVLLQFKFWKVDLRSILWWQKDHEWLGGSAGCPTSPLTVTMADSAARLAGPPSLPRGSPFGGRQSSGAGHRHQAAAATEIIVCLLPLSHQSRSPVLSLWQNRNKSQMKSHTSAQCVLEGSGLEEKEEEEQLKWEGKAGRKGVFGRKGQRSSWSTRSWRGRQAHCSHVPFNVQPIACHVDHLLSTVLDTCYHRWKGAGDSASCEETTLLSESITERRQLTAAFWIGWHRQTVRKENKGRWSD